MEDKLAVSKPTETDSPESDPSARAFVVERFLLNQLLRMARQMNGDFESLMIYGVLGLQAAARALTETSELPQATSASNDLLSDRLLRKQGLRSSELAQVTGVPRETVRRKLERLQTAGKVRRHDDGRWHACDSVAAPPSFARDALENFSATAALIKALPI